MMQARRQRPGAGYYLSLHTRSTADFDLSAGRSKNIKGRLQLSDSEQLPDGVFRVERLVTHKASKVVLQYILNSL